jgi:hypothetical protein
LQIGDKGTKKKWKKRKKYIEFYALQEFVTSGLLGTLSAELSKTPYYIPRSLCESTVFSVSLCENIIPPGCTFTMCMNVGGGLTLGVATALQVFILTQRHRGHRVFTEDF